MNVHARLEAKGYKLHLTDAAKEVIIEQGYHPEFGARPLRRAIERMVEDPLSEDLLSGRFAKGAEIEADTTDNKTLVFTEKKPAPEPAATQ